MFSVTSSRYPKYTLFPTARVCVLSKTITKLRTIFTILIPLLYHRLQFSIDSINLQQVYVPPVVLFVLFTMELQ